MECDRPTSPAQVVDSMISHDFQYIEFPSSKAIMDFMDSVDKTKDEVVHWSSFHDLELMGVIMMSLDLELGAFSRESSRPPSLDPFPPLLLFFGTSHRILHPLPSNIFISYLYILLGIIKGIP
jgi:hypothetical protein